MGARRDPTICDERNAANARSPRDGAGFLLRHKWEAALLILLPALLYGASLRFGFVLDDKIAVQENQYVWEGLAGIPKILASDNLAGFIGEQPELVTGSRYRPLSMVTFAIEHELYGLDPARSHLVNVALYALTCLVVYRLFWVIARDEEGRPRYLRLPFAAALLFALHPLHVEVVANIKGRDEILALLFSLTALLLVLRHARSGGLAPLALGGLAFLLALLAKENAITFLAVVPLTIAAFGRANARALLISMLPLAVAAAVYLLLRHQAVGHFLLGGGGEVTELMNNPFVEASTEERYGTIFQTWGLYLKLLFFPHPLTHDYYPYHVPLVGLDDLRALVPLLVYLALAAFALLQFRAQPVAAWSVLYFLATFSVVSNLFFSIGTFMNERFMYMPSVGFCLALAWLIGRKLPVWLGERRPLARLVTSAIAAAFALGFGLKTLARVPDWKDDMSLNRAAAEVSTGSARANCFMGYSLYEIALQEPDEARRLELLDEATSYVDRSLEIYPSYRDALNVRSGLLGARYLIDGDIDALLDGYFRILRANEPPHVEIFLSWLNEQGRHREQLAAFYFEVGYAYYFQERQDEARAKRYLGLGHRIAPEDRSLLEALAALALAQPNLEGSLSARRDAFEALKYAEEGIRLHPAHRRFYEIAAEAYAKLGNPADADELRRRAEQIHAP